MEKEILFLWFGDNEPKYANYTIENFRQINPTWNIKYITYSNQDLINYKLQNDSILEYSIDTIFKTRKYRHNSFLCDIYKYEYIRQTTKQKYVVYCDLDCFPIAPLDDFMFLKGDTIENAIWYQHNFFGTNFQAYQFLTSKNIELKDNWCISNFMMTRNFFYQIYKYIDMSKQLILNENGIIVNPDQIGILQKRKCDFFNCKIQLNDIFCNNQLTPIEHYYQRERNGLVKDTNNIFS